MNTQTSGNVIGRVFTQMRLDIKQMFHHMPTVMIYLMSWIVLLIIADALSPLLLVRICDVIASGRCESLSFGDRLLATAAWVIAVGLTYNVVLSSKKTGGPT